MLKFFEKTKGAVSIFLVLIMVPMMTVTSLFVDASKIKLAKGVSDSAADLALNTALTNYDTNLKDLYGLFATAQDMDELFERLEGYYVTSITSAGVAPSDAQDIADQLMYQLGLVGSGEETADILGMSVLDFDVSKRSDAALNNASVMKRQIVEFMKYRAPINTGLSFLSALESFSTLSKQTDLVDKRQEYYEAEADVMKNAQNAWDYIYKYNQEEYTTSDTYLPNMKTAFGGYQAKYETLAKKIMKDLYDTQSYLYVNGKDGEVKFKNYSYSLAEEKIEIDGKEKTAWIFYTNSEKTSKLAHYGELTTYSEESPATAQDIKKALNAFFSAYENYITSEEDLLEFDDKTYGLQALAQTNRGNNRGNNKRSLYEKWIDDMETLYNKHNALRHAVTYSGKTDEGKSVMETKEKLFRSSTAKKYSEYYEEFDRIFDLEARPFGDDLSEYTSKLQKYANAIGERGKTEDTETQIGTLYKDVTEYRRSLSDGSKHLGLAITELEKVRDALKSGGALDNAKEAWRTAADDKDLANTSMARQDQAEIESLGKYFKVEDVQKLIDRLNTVKGHLDAMVTQVDSYTFFGTKITEIDSYTTFKNILGNKIGDSTLKNLPLNEETIDQKISGWCNGQFKVGTIDVSWATQQNHQPNLTKNKVNFYSWLFAHFDRGNQTEAEETTQVSNAEDTYDQIKNAGKSETTAKTDSADDGNIAAAKDKDGKEKELKNLADRPSANQDTEGAPSGKVRTEDSASETSAAKSASGDLNGLFGNLGSKVTQMGVDLRDWLYVSEYILGMFSYDTIEKEFKDKNEGKELDIKSITLNPINAESNYAYGKEVEYIIYGGENAGNLTKAYGSIYAIRLGFNMIYAFMASDIRDTAFAIATPISAATMGVIPVPLIQAAIIVGIACAESGIDLANLKDGESVPLMKNSKTWSCSPAGLMQTAKAEIGNALREEVTEFVDESVDWGMAELTDLLNKTDEELTKQLEQGSNRIITSAESAYDELIERHANTAIQKLTTLCNTAIEEALLNEGTDKVKLVERGLDSWLAEERSRVNSSSDIGYIVKEEAVKLIKQYYISEVITVLETNAKTAQSQVAAAANAISDKLSELKEEIAYQIENACSKVIEYKDDLKADIESSIKKGADELKQTLNKHVDGFFGSGGVAGGGTASDTGMAFLLSFRYSDYLRLFLVIGMCTDKGEKSVLLRTADAIQANMAMKEKGYLLANSAVYVELDANVLVKPAMMALPLFGDLENNPVNNQKWYTVECFAVKGY